MLRAIRFAAKLGLTISERSAEPISRLAPLLQDIPSARLFEETIKLFLAGHALSTYHLLRKFGLFQQLFPQAGKLLTPEGNSAYERFLEKALAGSDKRVAADQPVTPTFFYATLLWGVVALRQREISNESNLPFQDAMQVAMNEAIEQQIHTVAIPRRFTSDVREIWLLQERLPRYSGKRAEKLFAQPKFRAAFDFLELRAQVEPRFRDIVAWWQDYQQTHEFIRPEHTHTPRPTAPTATAAVSSERPQSEEHAARKRPRRRRRYPQQAGQRNHD
jgi:poly(A) polymerase